jgi:hypothetical protein
MSWQLTAVDIDSLLGMFWPATASRIEDVEHGALRAVFKGWTARCWKKLNPNPETFNEDRERQANHQPSSQINR